MNNRPIFDARSVLIRQLIGPLWARWERSDYLRHYRDLKRSQFDSAKAIRARQFASIQKLVNHAYENTTFYRKRFDEAGIRPEEMRTFEDYQRIPILTKADIRGHGREMIARNYNRDDLWRKTTSGSTGVSLEVFIDDSSSQFKRACTLRSDEWSGWRFGEPTAMIWGNPEYLKRGWRGLLRNELLERKAYLDTLKMDETTMARFAQKLVDRWPSLIFGHAHSVFLFADFLRAKKIEPIRPRGIITSAMILHDWQRQVIEEVFNCRVTNRYGCEEVSMIACECEQHEGLHVIAESVFVELLREGVPTIPGEFGSVVVTDLVNLAMPIIRYQVGDVSAWSDSSCSCGRGMPLLKRIEGREADYVTTAQGDLISGISLTENFATLVPGIGQIQIVQEAIDRFTFRIVKAEDFGPESLEHISQLVSERFGEEAGFACEYVDHIPQEPSGKYRFCISKVPSRFTVDSQT